MKKHTILLIVILASLLTSCAYNESDYYLDQTVFIEDPENPRLPIYSEWGYNTFGAYIDRQPFISNNYYMPAKIIVYPDTLNLILTGETNGSKAILKFSFIGYSPKDYIDLVELDNDTIDLTDKNKCILTYTELSKPSVELHPFNGQFIFSRIQNLYVDNQLDKSIISGHFRFQTQYRNEYITVDKGRFDLGMGYDNFYYIER